MARINVDQQALTDARFARLAQLRGWADGDHALGKMLRVWSECIHRGPELEAWVIDHHLGAGAAGDLLVCRLAELVRVAGAVAGDPAGALAGGTLLRIKGTAGRTDYINRLASAAKLGGKARAASASREGGRFTSQPHQPMAGDDTSALALALALSPALSPAPAPAPPSEVTRAGRAKPKPVASTLPPDWSPRDQEREHARSAGLDCDSEAGHFRDHHAAKGSRFTDWDAAFRNWLRNAVKFASDRRGTGTLPLNQSIRKVEEL